MSILIDTGALCTCLWYGSFGHMASHNLASHNLEIVFIPKFFPHWVKQVVSFSSHLYSNSQKASACFELSHVSSPPPRQVPRGRPVGWEVAPRGRQRVRRAAGAVRGLLSAGERGLGPPGRRGQNRRRPARHRRRRRGLRDAV